jgi:hypothetical protein
MTFKKWITWLGLLAVLAALVGLAPTATQAAPLMQSNLLQNPGMEQHSSTKIGDGWVRWFQVIDKPDDASALQYALEPTFVIETNSALVHSGSVSQHIGRQYDPWNGGLKQTVTAPANAQLRFCAWSRLYAQNVSFGKEPSVTAISGRSRVGIFPNGDA